MTIGVDIRCLEGGKKTGVEEYLLNLLRNILKLDRKNQYVLFFNAFKGKNLDLEWTKEFRNIKIKSFRYPNKLFNLFTWYLGWPKIDRMIGGTDIFWMPNINFGSFSNKTKLIVTAHDLSFEILPENFPWKTRLWHFLINPRNLYYRSDRIIAVSDSTKNDLEKIYAINQEKISVIHSAAKEDLKILDRNGNGMLKIKEKYKLPYYFILYFGTIEPRKNIVSLVKAYNQLRRLKNSELEKYKLIIAGAKGWKEKPIFEEIKKSPFCSDIISLGFIKSEEKPYLYNLASLFVYPSFFEGFGFPPLEAMSCGVPVITSNNSSLPEIVGDAGILVDPKKPDEIFKAMREILLNKDLRLKLRDKGLEKAKKFDWRKTAEDFLTVINQFQ